MSKSGAGGAAPRLFRVRRPLAGFMDIPVGSVQGSLEALDMPESFRFDGSHRNEVGRTIGTMETCAAGLVFVEGRRGVATGAVLSFDTFLPGATGLFFSRRKRTEMWNKKPNPLTKLCNICYKVLPSSFSAFYRV